MKTFKYLSTVIILSLLLSSCFKENDDITEPDNDQPVESVEDLQVSDDFDWKTQQTVQVFVNLPANGEIQPLIITNRDKTKRYFKGYPEGNSRTVSTKITPPSYVRGLRLIYNGASGPNFAYINNGSLVYNFNDMRKSVQDDDCDLDGFTTYSKGGWGAPPRGNNPGAFMQQHFDDIYPDGLVVGDPNNNTVTFETAQDLTDYLPGSGKPLNSGVLDSDFTNPLRQLGNMTDQIVAAKLNRDYNEAGVLGDNDNYTLGELIYVEGPFKDYTVNEFLDMAEIALGGGGLNGFEVNDYKNAAEDIVDSFHEGNNANILTCPFDEDEEDQEPFIEVDVTCVDGDVIFTISNTGDGDMEDDFEYTVIKNDGTIDSDDYELDASQTIDFSYTGYDTDVFEIEVETPRGETLTENMTGCGEEEDNGGGDDDDDTITEDFQGTLAYEDLWPGKGDYDFNDLVIDYDFDITKNNQEIVQDITATFTIKAFGAAQHNGFGFTIPTLVPGDIVSVDGYDIDGSSVFDIASNGTEQNQSQATFIVFDDVRRVMPQTTPG
ncbi:MAG: LruC domain-containing protein, partial [Bacteroidota bacterium]